jgi:hypothetical protein
MKTKNNNTETAAAAAPEAPQDEYEYFDMLAEKYCPQRPNLLPNEEAEYLRRIKEFRERRREAGRKIDPETAEVHGFYGQILDPYEIDPLLPEECQCVGWNHFARSPGGDICVYFGDLPPLPWMPCRKDLKQVMSSLTSCFDPVPVGLDAFS